MIESNSKNGLIGFSGTFQARLKTMEERVMIILKAAELDHTRNFEKYGGDGDISKTTFEGCKEWFGLYKEIQQLKDDYAKVAKGGFEGRLKEIMEKAGHLVK